MATDFTCFPRLITELRLEIWRLSMPTPLRRPLYPYKKGCWVVEDLGLEPDPNGEDLHLMFNTSLLDPLRIELPLYAVNREARGVALKYIREQNLSKPQGSTPSQFEFLRQFDPRTDTMFLPTVDVETFLMEQVDRMTEPDMEDRYVSISCTVLPRLALTAPGLDTYKGDLGYFFDTCAPIGALYVVDVAYGSTYSIEELEYASRHIPLDLEDTNCVRLLWRTSSQEWEVTGDGQLLAWMRKLVTGLDDPSAGTSKWDLEIRFLHVTARELRSSSASQSLGILP